jgi:ATP-dependent Lon protease
MLDEIDNWLEFRGDPSRALLEVLDPEQNTRFRSYLDTGNDLSRFFYSRRRLHSIRSARCWIGGSIEIPGMWKKKLSFAEEFLIPENLNNTGRRGRNSV